MGDAVPIQRSNPVPERRVALFAVVILVIALVTTWWGMKRLLWFTSTGHAVAHVMSQAMSVNDLILVPPEARQNLPMTPAQVVSYRGQALTLLAHLYTGRVLAMWDGIARKTLDPHSLDHGKTHRGLRSGRPTGSTSTNSRSVQTVSRPRQASSTTTGTQSIGSITLITSSRRASGGALTGRTSNLSRGTPHRQGEGVTVTAPAALMR